MTASARKVKPGSPPQHSARSRQEREALILSLAPVVERLMRVVHIPGRNAEGMSESRQDAWLGAIKAVDMHDPGSGAALATYAAVRIRGEILDGARRRDQCLWGRKGRPPWIVDSWDEIVEHQLAKEAS